MFGATSLQPRETSTKRRTENLAYISRRIFPDGHRPRAPEPPGRRRRQRVPAQTSRLVCAPLKKTP